MPDFYRGPQTGPKHAPAIIWRAVKMFTYLTYNWKFYCNNWMWLSGRESRQRKPHSILIIGGWTIFVRFYLHAKCNGGHKLALNSPHYYFACNQNTCFVILLTRGVQLLLVKLYFDCCPIFTGGHKLALNIPWKYFVCKRNSNLCIVLSGFFFFIAYG